MVERLFGMVIIYFLKLHDVVKVEHGELLVHSVAVGPYVPHEKRPHDFGISRKEVLEVEEVAVVERGHDAHMLQSRSIALKVFDGVGIGVKHVGITAHGFGSERCSLHQVVVVGIDTGYHATAEPFA